MASLKKDSEQARSFKELYAVFKKFPCVRSVFVGWDTGTYLLTKTGADLRAVLTDLETEVFAHKQELLRARVRGLRFGDDRKDDSKNPIAN